MARPTARTGTGYSGLVRDRWRLWSAAVPAVVGRAELVAQPPERGPGRLVRYLGVDLHRERDTAVPEDGHRHPRVNVEAGRQRAACPARVVNGDAPDASQGSGVFRECPRLS